MQPWAAKTFEPEIGDIGPKTYAKVFELLLRLKANLIWPAMHPSTKAVFHYSGNVKTAEDYQIVVGSSHAEPMLRNNVSEWNKKTMGNFGNKDTVYKYWEDRVKESKNVNAIYTIGMRGVHDSPLIAQNVSKAGKEKAVHIVLFKFKEGVTTEQIRGLKDEILKQKFTTAGLLEISFGEDFTGRAKGYTHAEVGVFKDRESLENFNKSDYHQQLIVTHIRPFLEDILVLDYPQAK